MKTLLHISTSLFSGDGQSSRLAEAFVSARRAAEPATRVLVRDLAQEQRECTGEHRALFGDTRPRLPAGNGEECRRRARKRRTNRDQRASS